MWNLVLRKHFTTDFDLFSSISVDLFYYLHIFGCFHYHPTGSALNWSKSTSLGSFSRPVSGSISSTFLSNWFMQWLVLYFICFVQVCFKLVHCSSSLVRALPWCFVVGLQIWFYCCLGDFWMSCVHLFRLLLVACLISLFFYMWSIRCLVCSADFQYGNKDWCLLIGLLVKITSIE